MTAGTYERSIRLGIRYTVLCVPVGALSLLDSHEHRRLSFKPSRIETIPSARLQNDAEYRAISLAKALVDVYERR